VERLGNEDFALHQAESVLAESSETIAQLFRFGVKLHIQRKHCGRIIQLDGTADDFGSLLGSLALG